MHVYNMHTSVNYECALTTLLLRWSAFTKGVSKHFYVCEFQESGCLPAIYFGFIFYKNKQRAKYVRIFVEEIYCATYT